MLYSANPSVPTDTHLVTLATPSAIAYWTCVFACSETELREALAFRGPRPIDVHRYLVHTYGPAHYTLANRLRSN